MSEEIRIGGKKVGHGNPCFIIGEAGVNHNGKIENALKLVDIAYEAGIDAIKFQLYRIEEQISQYSEAAPYQYKRTNSKMMATMAKSYDLPWEQHKKIVEYCDKIGITYMASCFDPSAVDFLINKLKGDCIKVGSGELTNYPLLKYIASTGKPVLLSTGMSTLDDVKGAVINIQSFGSSPLILLHCVSNYPVKAASVNLRAMMTMANVFNLPVGYSDHTLDNMAAIVAVAMGACVIEKHFTLDKTLPGPDHAMSLDPGELKIFVNTIKTVESILGDSEKKPTKEELEMQKYSRRSLVSTRKIKVGEKLERNDIALKRPATGIDPRSLEKAIGRKAKKDIPDDIPITWDMLE